ncbi:MAG: N-acetyltransferase [Chloroflexi bacterium AL-W]|nr:N-acetyltransferase [Chloroflexi bacterium AL-N1]NOK70033.1 N-acetyltransferase [Chloroflexi bacterium AL-N10]NOK77955.1 N-acetyltransferase [Chloroflexi bacterium AL-N5]NOK84964.1 N-acetyltransferase [Chloroflexi bacterium AL-W]NOK91943.1 N-acetyltransferase [Chloroflexi bacterium AL-N15]
MNVIIETARLTVRPFTLDDAPFIVRLLNEPSFIEHIADMGVRTLDDARNYLRDRPMASYTQHGFGLWRVGLKESDTPIGMAGLLSRETLDNIDLGYAFLSAYFGKGYAFEVTSAIMTYARVQLGYRKVVAVVHANNEPSIRLLRKLGFNYERMVRLADDQEEIQLFVAVG